MNFFGRGANGFTAKKSVVGSVGELAVLFPGPDGWEAWTGSPEQPLCAGPAEKPGLLRPSAGCVLGLPARSFFSLPLWVPVVPDSPPREQTQIKLEMKGMLGANPDGAVWNFEAIRKEEVSGLAEGELEPSLRQLEATAVLAFPFQEDWLIEQAVRYEPAGRMLPAPGDGAWGVLRRELGRWVADFYQNGRWIHAQALLSTSLDGSAAAELAATMAQLEGEGILTRLDGWRIWGEGTNNLADDFRKMLGAPVQREDRPTPRAPEQPWNLPPPALTEIRAERSRRLKRKQYIRIGITVYLTTAFLLALWLAWPLVRLKLAQRELAEIGAEAESIRSTAMLWREAGAWLDSRRNTMELLWQVSRPLIESEPPAIEGVRLTLFDLNSKRLRLEGEGKDLEKVEQYFQWLQKEPALAGFNWTTPPPTLLGSGNARFLAEAVPPGGSIENEEGGQPENPDAP